MLRWLSWLACGEGDPNSGLAAIPPPQASAQAAQGARALPETAAVTLLGARGIPALTVRVAPKALAARDPRFRAADRGVERYNGQNDPWEWTDAQRTLAAALDLRDLLTQISCGREADLAYAGKGDLSYRALGACAFSIAPWSGPGDDAGSILVGTPADFGLTDPFSPPDRYGREQHLARTSGDRLLLLGAEGAGVERAVWAFAEEIGYRWFLPTPAWEIVPEHTGQRWVSPRIDRLGGASSSRPGYVTRHLTGVGSKGAGYDLAAWRIRNGLAGSLQMKGIQGGWGRIYEADRAWYDANPQSISESSRPSRRGKSPGTKLCPGYRDKAGQSVPERIVERWAAAKLAVSDPKDYSIDITRDQLALHHGDSTFWAGCEPRYKAGGTPADRTLLLTSEVARLARERGILGQRLVSLMAYREVFPGPLSAKADPDVFVYLVGDGYQGSTIEEAIERWKSAGAKHFGLYRYWSEPSFALPMDLGPQAPSEEARQLASLEAAGARSLWIEANGGWGANGLFRWALLQIATDPARARTDPEGAVAERIEEILSAFPTAARPHVRRALSLLDASERRLLLSTDLVADLYEALGSARRESQRARDDSAVRRSEDLLLYARHLDLYLRFERAGRASERYADLVEHAYCNDDRRMVDYRQLWGGLGPERLAKKAYLDAHEGRTPEEVLEGGARCPAPDFDAWLAKPPDRALQGERWYAGGEGSYGKPAVYPGTASAGRYEQSVRQLPRDTLLWRALLDRPAEIGVRAVCHGLLGEEHEEPAKFHVTSRLLGEARVEIRAPSGAVACTAEIPPTRQAWDLTFRAGGPEAAPSEALPAGSLCELSPRELSLDTGEVETTVDITCDPGLLSGPGLYDIFTINHRTGLDYSSMSGVLGLAKWDSPALPNRQRRPEMGPTERYFYVPVGTKAVALWNGGGPCKVLRDTIPAHRVDLDDGVPGYHLVPTKTPDGARHDGEIWALASCVDAYLVNVPPVVSPERQMLLVPCALAGTPGYAPLKVDRGACR